MERSFLSLNSKGQATIEFLLVMIVALTYIIVVVQPNADIAGFAAEDVANISKFKLSTEKLANAIQYVSISGQGTKESMVFFLPIGSTLSCTSPANQLTLNYPLRSKGSTGCFNDDDAAGNDPNNLKNCKKIINPGVDFSCTPSSGVGSAQSTSSRTYTTYVQKDSAGTISVHFT